MAGPQDTSRVKAILSAEWRGRALNRAMARVAGPFPVAGWASWSNDWHAYRPCPHPHMHKGLDVFASRGTPVVAAANGVLTRVGTNRISGLFVEIRDASGVEYFYAHLDTFASGLRLGRRVRVGAVLGFVGDTGNAKGTPPHLHFEVQPYGVAVPPKPFVDRWLLAAEEEARALVRRARRSNAEEADVQPWPTERLLSANGIGNGPRPVFLAYEYDPPAAEEPATEPVADTLPWNTLSVPGALVFFGFGTLLLRLHSRRTRRLGAKPTPEPTPLSHS